MRFFAFVVMFMLLCCYDVIMPECSQYEHNDSVLLSYVVMFMSMSLVVNTIRIKI